MPQQLLHGADVIPVGQKVRGEGMTERVAGRSLGQSGVPDRLRHGLLHNEFINVMSPLLSRFGICPSVLLREDPLPAPVGSGVGVFAVEGVRHLDTSPPILHILFMDRFDLSQMVLKRRLERFGQHRHAVLCAFAISNCDLAAGKVNVLHPKPQAFHQPETCTVHERGHQPLVAVKLAQNRLHLLARQDDG